MRCAKGCRPPPLSKEEVDERKRLRGKAYREAHPEENAARTRKWQLENPEKVKAACDRHHRKFRKERLARYRGRKYGLSEQEFN